MLCCHQISAVNPPDAPIQTGENVLYSVVNSFIGHSAKWPLFVFIGQNRMDDFLLFVVPYSLEYFHQALQVLESCDCVRNYRVNGVIVPITAIDLVLESISRFVNLFEKSTDDFVFGYHFLHLPLCDSHSQGERSKTPAPA